MFNMWSTNKTYRSRCNQMKMNGKWYPNAVGVGGGEMCILCECVFVCVSVVNVYPDMGVM